MRLQDVMTREMPVLAPTDTIRDAARRMADCRMKALPVCDDRGRLVGVVTDWDVTKAAASIDDLRTVPVRDAMSHDVLAAHPAATLDEASEMMGDRGLHHLCVSENGDFRGMVHLDVDWAQLGPGVQAPHATFSARL